MRKNCSNCQNHTWGDEWWNCTPECHRCRYRKEQGEEIPSNWKPLPVTNADRIRAMSDEELALFVRAIIRAEDCPAVGCDCDKCFFKEPCFNGSKWHNKETEWLKQPVK